MLKPERSDLLFAEKCSIFAFAKEEAVRSKRLPPFLGPACEGNYPALAQNYKALGFIYVLFGENYKALGKSGPLHNRKNPAQKEALGKFMLNLLMHFYALSGLRKIRIDHPQNAAKFLPSLRERRCPTQGGRPKERQGRGLAVPGSM